jgi:methionyl-tRNA formyltransferase
MKISILTDNQTSWFIQYGKILEQQLLNLNHDVVYVYDKHNLREGDICFLLSCSRIVEDKFLLLHKNNIVVHASDLPNGKGFSPLQWQILDGSNKIVLSLIEAVSEVDAGPIYFKHSIIFEGHELYNELRVALGLEIIDMCLKYVIHYKELKPVQQVGESTFYRKRTKIDDQIDPCKTITELFNHFRIADNQNYPLYFYLNGYKYLIKIEKENNNNL